MFCKHCGKEIPNESKFCPYCGEDMSSFTTTINTVIPDETIMLKPDTQQVEAVDENTSYFDTKDIDVKTGKKKNSKAIFIILGLILLIALLTGLFFLFNSKSIKTSDFVTVSISDDLNGYANAHVNVDYNKLNDLIGGRNMDRAFKKITGQSTGFIDDIKSLFSNNATNSSIDSSKFIEYKVENDKNLSNNDQVVVKFVPGQLASYNQGSALSFDEICKLLRIRLEDEISYNVSGLQDGVVVNAVMPDIEKYISFVGSQGKGKAVFNTSNLSYTFNNNYKVTFKTPNTGEVTKNGAYVGNLLYIIEAGDTNVNLEQLKQGDVIQVRVEPDENLAKELSKDKIMVNSEPVAITVKKLGESLDPSKISTNDLIAMAQPVVINTRNNHMNDKTAILDQVYKLTKKSDSSYGLAYVFKTTDNSYCMTIAKDIVKDSTNDSIGFDYDSFDIGKSLDLTNHLSAYDYTYLGNNEVLKYKYAVGKNGIVINKGVRVRNGAGTNFTHVKIDGKLANYEEGEVLEIIDEAIGNDSNIWYKVNLVRGGKTYSYWISGMYLQIVY